MWKQAEKLSYCYLCSTELRPETWILENEVLQKRDREKSKKSTRRFKEVWM